MICQSFKRHPRVYTTKSNVVISVIDWKDVFWREMVLFLHVSDGKGWEKLKIDWCTSDFPSLHVFSQKTSETIENTWMQSCIPQVYGYLCNLNISQCYSIFHRSGSELTPWYAQVSGTASSSIGSCRCAATTCSCDNGSSTASCDLRRRGEDSYMPNWRSRGVASVKDG